MYILYVFYDVSFESMSSKNINCALHIKLMCYILAFMNIKRKESIKFFAEKKTREQKKTSCEWYRKNEGIKETGKSPKLFQIPISINMTEINEITM